MPESRPFVAFNFLVEIAVDGIPGHVADASFSECDGLEMKIEVKTIHEGGRNTGPVLMMGPVNYGNLTLKRGLTDNTDLVDWFEKAVTNPGLRSNADITILSAEAGAQSPNASFTLTGVMPVSVKFPALSGREGQVAIEEMHLAYETMARSF